MLPPAYPFRQIEQFHEMFNDVTSSFETNTSVNQSVDHEDGTLKTVIDVPGVEKEDLHAKVVPRENGRQILVVQGDRSTDIADHSFRNVISLQERVDPESAESKYHNGILTLVFDVATNEENGVEIDLS